MPWREPAGNGGVSPREGSEGCSIFVGTQMRKQLILPRTGLRGRKVFPREEVASDGVSKHMGPPGKLHTSDKMRAPCERGPSFVGVGRWCGEEEGRD